MKTELRAPGRLGADFFPLAFSISAILKRLSGLVRKKEPRVAYRALLTESLKVFSSPYLTGRFKQKGRKRGLLSPKRARLKSCGIDSKALRSQILRGSPRRGKGLAARAPLAGKKLPYHPSLLMLALFNGQSLKNRERRLRRALTWAVWVLERYYRPQPGKKARKLTGTECGNVRLEASSESSIPRTRDGLGGKLERTQSRRHHV